MGRTKPLASGCRDEVEGIYQLGLWWSSSSKGQCCFLKKYFKTNKRNLKWKPTFQKLHQPSNGPQREKHPSCFFNLVTCLSPLVTFSLPRPVLCYHLNNRQNLWSPGWHLVSWEPHSLAGDGEWWGRPSFALIPNVDTRSHCYRHQAIPTAILPLGRQLGWGDGWCLRGPYLVLEPPVANPYSKRCHERGCVLLKKKERPPASRFLLLLLF